MQIEPPLGLQFVADLFEDLRFGALQPNGVAVQVDNRLAEGSDPSNVVGWICQAPDDGLVLCSHGDILPEVLRLLALRGMTLDGPPAVQKASVWVCDIRDGQPHHASYIPPPRLS